MPSLWIFGDSEEPRMFESVLPGLTTAHDTLLEHRVIEGADHNFAARGSTERLFAVLTEWLSSTERPWAVPRRAREEREGGKRAA